MRGLLDTCVIIDFLQQREPFCEDAYAVFSAAANRAFDGFVTAKSLTDVYYLTRHDTHDDKKTRMMLVGLMAVLTVLDTAGIDCHMALSSGFKDFEDGVMAETALRSGMDAIITRNKRDFAESLVPVYTPTEFMSLLELESEEK